MMRDSYEGAGLGGDGIWRLGVPGQSEVLVPGEPESRMRAQRTANGIPLSADAWAAISGAGQDLGITPPQPVA